MTALRSLVAASSIGAVYRSARSLPLGHYGAAGNSKGGPQLTCREKRIFRHELKKDEFMKNPRK